MKKLLILVLMVFLFSSCMRYNDTRVPDDFVLTAEFKEIASTEIKVQVSDTMESLITNKADPLLELVTLDFYHNGLYDNTEPAYEYSCWVMDLSTKEKVGVTYRWSPDDIESTSFHGYITDSLMPNTSYEFVVYYYFSTYAGMPPNCDSVTPGILGLKPYLITYNKRFPFRTLSK